jgi:peptidoglycan biosynthesis protein MviN/MurJ (putative lipid II flippase)
VRVVLGSGSFDWTDTRLTAAVFALLSVSLAAQALILLLARAYYAAGRTFIPFFIAVFSMVSTLGLAVMLIGYLEHGEALRFVENLMRLRGVAGSAIIAIPIAYSAVSLLAGAALIAHFEYRFGGFVEKIWATLVQATFAAIGAASAAYATLLVLGPLSLSSTLLSVLFRGALAGGIGVAAAALIYGAVRNREYAETVAVARGKLWRAPLQKAQPIASAEEISASSPR